MPEKKNISQINDLVSSTTPEAYSSPVTNVYVTTSVSGISASNFNVVSGGTVILTNGATLSDSVVSSGGSISIVSGSRLYNTVISSGGYVSAYETVRIPSNPPTNMATVSNITVESGGKLIVGRAGHPGYLSGHSYNTVVKGGGTIYLYSHAVESGGTILPGGAAKISSENCLVDVTLTKGAKLSFFEGDILNPNIFKASINEFGYMTIGFYASATQAPQTIHIQFKGTYDPSLLTTDGVTITYSCYLAGTKIRTPQGLKLVETLRSSDQIFVWDAKEGKEKISSIRWVGSTHIEIDRAMPNDIAGYPVCFKAGSLGKNTPERDLLVTPEHCMFIDGVFIPARLLVNGSNVYFDKNFLEYEAYHIETEEHSIIWADGALSESYLDTGNRKNFTNSVITALVPENRNLSWERAAAAKLATLREDVEPIFNRICREGNIVYDSGPKTNDPDIHIVASDNECIYPTRIHEKKYIFRINKGYRAFFLISRASRPCDVIGPFLDDRRSLGVLVGDISLFNKNGQFNIKSHLLHKKMIGWHELEGKIDRWTSGFAEIPIDRDLQEDDFVLVIEIKSSGPYLEKGHDLSSLVEERNINIFASLVA